MVVSSTSINVANITAAAISHGLKLGAHGAVCGAICGSAEAVAATSVFRSVFFVSEFIVASFLGALISSSASLPLIAIRFSKKYQRGDELWSLRIKYNHSKDLLFATFGSLRLCENH
jgi:hypothetical protein